MSLLDAARKSTWEVSSISRGIFNFQVKSLLSLHQKHTSCWNNTLDHFQVQSKVKDMHCGSRANFSHLESPSKWPACWPAFINSFSMQVLTVSLPPWIYIAGDIYWVCKMCQLCNSANPTTVHILNGCQEALSQGCFTWRHDSVLNCLFNHVSSELNSPDKLCVDLPGLGASDSTPAILPASISTSTARSDMLWSQESTSQFLNSPSQATQVKLSLLQSQGKVTNLTISIFSGKRFEHCLRLPYTLEIGSLGHYDIMLSKPSRKHSFYPRTRSNKSCWNCH